MGSWKWWLNANASRGDLQGPCSELVRHAHGHIKINLKSWSPTKDLDGSVEDEVSVQDLMTAFSGTMLASLLEFWSCWVVGRLYWLAIFHVQMHLNIEIKVCLAATLGNTTSLQLNMYNYHFYYNNDRDTDVIRCFIWQQCFLTFITYRRQYFYRNISLGNSELFMKREHAFRTLVLYFWVMLSLSEIVPKLHLIMHTDALNKEISYMILSKSS